MWLVDEYMAAFSRCYPHHQIVVLPKHRRNAPEVTFAVVINGDRGERELTEAELRSSTRDFNRGKAHHD